MYKTCCKVWYKNRKPLLFTMIKFYCVFLHLAVIGFSVWGVQCFSPEEQFAALELMKPLAEVCVKDCDLTVDELKKEDMHPCLKKCMLNKVGLINDDGVYDHDITKKQIEMFTQNAEKAKEIMNLLDNCFEGREDSKKDKEAEEERINMIVECMKNSQSR